jgi:hypothetical protein
MLSIAYVFAIFSPTYGRRNTAYRLGEQIGVSLGMIAFGVALGTLVWLPARAIKGPSAASDFKLYVLVGTIISAGFLLLGQWGPTLVG